MLIFFAIRFSAFNQLGAFSFMLLIFFANRLIHLGYTKPQRFLFANSIDITPLHLEGCQTGNDESGIRWRRIYRIFNRYKKHCIGEHTWNHRKSTQKRGIEEQYTGAFQRMPLFSRPWKSATSLKRNMRVDDSHSLGWSSDLHLRELL